MKQARLAILVGPRGRGSNMRALALACFAGELTAEVAVVVSPRDGTPAVEWARDHGITVTILDPGSEGYAERLLGALREAQVGWICLAGYLRLLPADVLRGFPQRVLNIHPALLPRHGGKGMYGMKVHEAVLESGDFESGCTVHFVDERYDEGEIVHQLRCPILSGDTPESLSLRVLKLEHLAYKQALQKLLNDGEE
ncbi:MAG: phosphoribosylglycinamide formyltransferase [Chthonomonadaceae bacterium]|uniref:Phosphoribosylglycinamide formyltransferase n=1 Tax=Candidatus Nitrosymbiomonas proteolyticus TaxID=2608984 RepID=A0A809RTX5_9BACT|nr:phosphoribosylglycinamide formyltransferase [Candidatus Nitrosymbiomonas proteolyticus]